MWIGTISTFVVAMTAAFVIDYKYDATDVEIYLAMLAGAILSEVICIRLNLFRGPK